MSLHFAKKFWPIMLLVLAVGLAGCADNGSLATPISAEELTAIAIANQPTATSTRLPTLRPTETATTTPTITPSPTLTPTSTPIPTNTALPTATETQTPAPAQDSGTDGPVWTPPPLDQAMTIGDHYWFGRPIPYGSTTWAARNYPYGGTNGGRLQVHHGIDLVNQTGTPVIAAKEGTVYYAGDDIGAQFGPRSNFYGNVIVIQHDVTTPDTGEPIYTLYGHLSSIEVSNGQRVGTGDQIGRVGAAGVALGPHLHFEVRLSDPHDYGRTRNPELWIQPYRGYGTLTGRIVDANGSLLRDVTLNVLSVHDASFRRSAFSYATDTVNSDNTFGENFTLGDLPEGYYNLSIRDGGGEALYRDQIYIYPNRSTWVDIRLR